MGVHKDFIQVLLTDLKCEKSVCVWGGEVTWCGFWLAILGRNKGLTWVQMLGNIY
jgi:hypothetical protein